MKNYVIKSYLLRSITNNSDNYDEKYMDFKFDSDDDLPLRRTS